ncbi:MAG: type II secretion system F family protein [Candidatus Omnitrophica bacterium]|nr:type II secretion system F family protein [Candidatus Omnitrophota bacterium]
MLLPILILGLIFSSVTILTWQLYPAGAQAVGIYHDKRVSRDSQKLARMFLWVPRKKLILIYVISPFITAVAGFITVGTVFAAAIGAVFGIALPALVLRIMEKNRIRKFCQQLVDGLMIMCSSLKGGLSLLQSIEVLVEEMPAPLSQEFGLVLRENKLGVPLDECMERLNKRIKSDELNLVVTAIDIARETGGNLTEPLEKLMFTIRERDKLMGKVKTLTIQGKLQGIIMSAMPIIFGVVVYYLNPGFFDIMLETEVGRMLLIGAGVLEIIGSFLLWKLSQVEV